VAGFCNLVGAVFFLTYHRSGGGKYQVSRLGLLIGNRWMLQLVVLECANCSLHETVEGALSETVATVSLSTVPRLSLARGRGGVVSTSTDSPCVHVHAGIK